VPRPAEPPRLFVLAGMPRAGTTFLYHALAGHPGFHLPPRKELRYFSHHHERGSAWYARRFGAVPAGRVCADLSPDYFMHPGTAGRIAAHPAEVRVALAVRSPAEWAVSLHRHLLTFEPSVPPFAEFLQTCRYPDFQWPGQPERTTALSLTDNFIRRRLEEFQAALGPRLLLYDFAAFERDPAAVVRWIERFCGIDQPLPAAALPRHKVNARTAPSRNALTYWLSREPVSELVSRVMPRSLTLALRRRWEAKPAATAPALGDDTADLELARVQLAADAAAVAQLFAQAPVVTGDRSAFPP